MSTTRPPAYQRLAELLIGARVAMALRVVAEHQIADHLASGPQTAEALSRATGIPASTLRRLLRGLAALGVFVETAEERFANTDVAAYMRTDATPSLRDMILILNDDALFGAGAVARRPPRGPRPLPPTGCPFPLYRPTPPGRDHGQVHGGIYDQRVPKLRQGIPLVASPPSSILGVVKGISSPRLCSSIPPCRGRCSICRPRRTSRGSF